MAEPVHFDLGSDELPAAWFNLVPDMVGAGMQPLPPLHPGTREPIGPADLAPLFPESLIMQEVSTERWIDIPGPVLDVYRLWRPTPLYRSGPTPGAGVTDSGPDLLQIRGDVTDRLPQAEHGDRSGLLQQGSGDPPDQHRDRGRAMGVGADPADPRFLVVIDLSDRRVRLVG